MDPQRWIDISVPVAAGFEPLWPGCPPVRLDKRLSFAAGDAVDDTTVCCSVHTGTHLDAPRHVIPGGSTADELSMDALCGGCSVVDLGGAREIDERALAAAWPPAPVRRCLLKTTNSRLWGRPFDPGFVGLTLDGAAWLARLPLALVGIDYLSIQPVGGSPEIHRTLLAAGIAILEGLDLSRVAAGEYELVCLPLRLVGVEGAPARAVLAAPDPAGAPRAGSVR